ncbi:MAG: type II toxin-antitoxin system PemK/MazF family toxin [Patescibacteria group bacterium]
MVSNSANNSKEFDRWNGKKKVVHTADTSDVYFYEREVWWVYLGANVGFEQDGTGEEFERPVLIIKKFNPNVFIGVPLSTTEKTGKYYFSIGEVESKHATAILSQIRLLDAKRLINRAGIIDSNTFDALVLALVDANFRNLGKVPPRPLRGGGEPFGRL